MRDAVIFWVGLGGDAGRDFDLIKAVGQFNQVFGALAAVSDRAKVIENSFQFSRDLRHGANFFRRG
jgi:hypothetical protein